MQKAFAWLRNHTRPARADDTLHGVDDRFEAQLRRVQYDRVGRRAEGRVGPSLVPLVTSCELAGQRLLVDGGAPGAKLRGATPGPLGGRGRQVELGGRVREDDRPDVATLHDDAPARPEGALEGH